MALKITCEMWHVFGSDYLYTNIAIADIVHSMCVCRSFFYYYFFFFKFNSLSFIIRFLQCVKFTHSLMMTISRFHICFKVLISRKRMFRFEKIVFISRHHHRHWQTTATIDKQNTEKYAKFFFVVVVKNENFFFVSSSVHSLQIYLICFCFWHNLFLE